jgi:hypothetical protein
MPLRAEARSARGFNDYSTSSMTQTLTLPPLQVKWRSLRRRFRPPPAIAEKIPPAFIAIVFAQRQRFFSLIAVGQYHHAARILSVPLRLKAIQLG